MTSNAQNAPVLFLIFNRPNKARRVFERIREAQPAQIFIAADGPRENKPGETMLCKETRKTVLDLIDWPCEVKSLFRDENLGCKNAVNSAITWFFQHVKEGIILEDDCLPDLSFFSFCSDMLERYRDNKQVMHIGGANNVDYIPEKNVSYYFSHFASIWGWATWKDAWEQNNQELTNWPEIKEKNILEQHCISARERALYEKHLDAVYSQELDTWDYGWSFTITINDGVSILPRHNLVRNIGFGPGAAHTSNPLNKLRFRKAHSLVFPLIHPDKILRDETYDTIRDTTYYKTNKLIQLAKYLLPPPKTTL